MNFNDWIDQGANSLTAIWYQMLNVLPNIIGAILLLIIGWLLAKLAHYLVRKLLQTVRFDAIGTKISSTANLGPGAFSVKPSVIVAKFVYWIVMLVFLISAFNVLGLIVVSEAISNLINYLPRLFSAIVIFVIGLYIAGFVRNFLQTAFNSFGLTAGNFLSQIAFYIILIIVGTAALDQAGIDTTIITANITLILGGILLAFGIAFGFSSRDIMANILASFYAQNNFSEGQNIIIDGQTAEIINIDSVQTVLKVEDGELIIPTKRLTSETIKKI